MNETLKKKSKSNTEVNVKYLIILEEKINLLTTQDMAFNYTDKKGIDCATEVVKRTLALHHAEV